LNVNDVVTNFFDVTDAEGWETVTDQAGNVEVIVGGVEIVLIILALL